MTRGQYVDGRYTEDEHQHFSSSEHNLFPVPTLCDKGVDTAPFGDASFECPFCLPLYPLLSDL